MVEQGVKVTKVIGLVLIVLAFATPSAFAVEGWGESATGGAGGTVVTVSDEPNFLDYISRTGKYIIQVDSHLTLPIGMHDVASNKTIIGVGPNAKISQGGLDIDGVDNVIVRNMHFADTNDDAINLQDGSTNIWIYHCSFTNGYDGLIDIKRASDYVTVSWNRFYNHHKTCLLGHSDSNGDQDSGHLRVTYHHNWFDGTVSRHPRVRFSALCHVYNNYYVDNSYGVASTCDAEVLVEGNYFDGCYAPTYVGYGSSPDGDLVERDNIIIGNTISPETRGTVPEPPYIYTIDDANNVPDIVQAYAGADNPEPPHWFCGPYGDFDRIGPVDIHDLETFADYWLETTDINDADYFDNGVVDGREFALFAESWQL